MTSKLVKHGTRSGFESRVAAELVQEGISYEYESVKVRYTKPSRTSTYTPDIIIRETSSGVPKGKPLYCELKGRFLTADRQKHLLIRKEHGDAYDIRFVFQNPNAKIGKKSKTTYAMWCDKHGFQYAKNHIPKEWIDEE